MIWRHPENRGIRGRRLLGWISWQVWQRTVARPRVIEMHDGVRMVCHPHDDVTSLAMYCGLYDSPEMRFLLAWLRPGDTFLDVGANVAPYSLLTTLVGGVRAVAFEPGTSARERAEANIRLNDAEESVEVVPSAVSAVDGTGRLSADRWATNSLVGDGYEGESEQIAVTSLDSFARTRDLDRVRLVKIDVEGHEPDVLRGAGELIARHRPALIVECNEVDALRRFSAENAYTLVEYHPDAGTIEVVDWPHGPGGNVVLVADLEQARARLARPGREAAATDHGREVPT